MSEEPPVRRVIGFREQLAELQRVHARAMSRLVAAHNTIPVNRTLSSVTYRDMMADVANAARAVADAADEIVWWMGYHDDVREADGLPPVNRIG